MEQVKPVKIEATVMWAFLSRKNDLSDAYQVDLCNISDSDAAALERIGISVKENPNKPEKGKYITCKSKNFEIEAYDTHGDRIEGDVGNGSQCRALIGTYDWKWKNKSGVSPSLKKLVITELVRYSREEDEEEDLTL